MHAAVDNEPSLMSWRETFGPSPTTCRRASHPLRLPAAIACHQASMDSPLATQLFRQLFSHRASQCLIRGARPALAHAARSPQTQQTQHRGKATNAPTGAPTSQAPRLGAGETKRESRWHPRRNAFPHERAEEFDRYPLVTSDMLRSRRERPRRVKMLLRDFIEGRDSPSGM